MLSMGWIKRFWGKSGTIYAAGLAVLAGGFVIFVLLPMISPYVIEGAKSDFEGDLRTWIAGSFMLLIVLICLRLNGRSHGKQFRKGVKQGSSLEEKRRRWRR